jgi:hypothetical protein
MPADLRNGLYIPWFSECLILHALSHIPLLVSLCHYVARTILMHVENTAGSIPHAQMFIIPGPLRKHQEWLVFPIQYA